MTSRAVARILLLAAPLAADASGAPPPPPAGVAIVRNAEGRQIGRAVFDPARGGVKVQLQVAGLAPGLHGLHLHAVGRCELPDFASAGPHFNPAARHHGLRSRSGAHAGDLPNLRVSRDGTARATFTARGASLGEGLDSLLGPDGASIIIAERRDDGWSDPEGSSGGRIACGVIQRR